MGSVDCGVMMVAGEDGMNHDDYENKKDDKNGVKNLDFKKGT